MNCVRLKISIMLLLALTAFPSFGKKRSNAVAPFLETRISRNNTIEGDLLIYEVTLFSQDPNIAGVELSKNPFFDHLSASRSAADHSLAETERDGFILYNVVIDRFFVSSDDVGKHKLKGGEYKIGYNRQVQMEDPFWGPYVANSVEVVSLSAPDVMLNVSKLPSKGMPDSFSGAVGDFNIEVELPSEELLENEDAYAVVTITGRGDLSKAGLPDVRGLFPENLQFKSMTESRSHFVKDGEIMSEIEIECTFIPHAEGEYILQGCEFVFYNPDKKRYIAEKSPPVNVKVVKGKTHNDSPIHYMDI